MMSTKRSSSIFGSPSTTPSSLPPKNTLRHSSMHKHGYKEISKEVKAYSLHTQHIASSTVFGKMCSTINPICIEICGGSKGGDALGKIEAGRSLCLNVGLSRQMKDRESIAKTTIAKHFTAQCTNQMSFKSVEPMRFRLSFQSNGYLERQDCSK